MGETPIVLFCLKSTKGDLFEVNLCPGNPFLDLFVFQYVIYVQDVVGVNILAQQEPVNESLNLRILALRELAVTVLALNRESHTIFNTKFLLNLTGCYA